MILNARHIEKLSEKIGQDVTTPSGATVLQLDIASVTGIALGLNTVKRLVGVIDDPGTTPRITTLNVLAHYLGYKDWAALEADPTLQGSGFNKESLFIEMSELAPDTEVEIAWQPDRRISLRHDGEGHYTVLKSQNSKLAPEDILHLSQLAVGFPFVTGDVIRNGRSLGRYQAAQGAGITKLIISDVNSPL